MPVDNKIKKKVTTDWLEHFTELRPYAQNQLYKIVGPVIVGIEIIAMPGVPEYRPHFALYPLYGRADGNNLKACMRYPSLFFELKDKKGFQLDLPYNDVRETYKEAIQAAEDQIPIPLKGAVTLNSMYKLIDQELEKKVIKIHAGKVGELYDLMFFSSLYVNDRDQIERVLSSIDDRASKWDLAVFEGWMRQNFNDWRKGLEEKVRQRDAFLELIQSNLQDPKMQKLIHSELIQ